MLGALDGKGSLRLGAEGQVGSRMYIRTGQWSFRESGSWSGWVGPGTWGGTSRDAIRLYGAMIGFDVEQIERGIDPATCVPGTATKDGRPVVTYDYHVSKWIMGPFIDHEKLTVDAGSGVPILHEMQGRPVKGDRPAGPKREVTFRLDPSITIDPQRPQ